MSRRFLWVVLPGILLMTGCAGTMTGLDGESKFACKAPDGVTCSSLSGVYANAVANNLPALRRDGKAVSSGAAPGSPNLPGKAASAGDPLRTSPQVMRIWIAPWEDADGDLHDQSYLYVVTQSGHWDVAHSQRQIVERYRPTFLRNMPQPNRTSSGPPTNGVRGATGTGVPMMAPPQPVQRPPMTGADSGSGEIE